MPKCSMCGIEGYDPVMDEHDDQRRPYIPPIYRDSKDITCEHGLCGPCDSKLRGMYGEEYLEKYYQGIITAAECKHTVGKFKEFRVSEDGTLDMVCECKYCGATVLYKDCAPETIVEIYNPGNITTAVQFKHSAKKNE